MERDEKLKLDYEQTTNYYHQLADSRFKLLAFVPLVTGAAIGLLSNGTPMESVLAIGILGFFVTLGIFIYNQRNTQIFDTMILRAKVLETLLQFETLDDKHPFGGPFLTRPRRNLKVFGTIQVWGDQGLAIVYGTTFGGWSYLITNSMLFLLGVSRALSNALTIGIPVIVALAFIWQVRRWDRETEAPDNFPSKAMELIDPAPKDKHD